MSIQKTIDAQVILRTKVTNELQYFEKMKFSPASKTVCDRMDEYLGFLESVIAELNTGSNNGPYYYPLETICEDMQHINKLRLTFFNELKSDGDL